MSDIDLRQSVLDELEFEPSLNAANIAVAVEEGIVTLTGHVPTFAEKVAAERATARVRGVRGIAQEIEVRPPGKHPTADDEIARRIADVLRWNTAVPKDAVKVSVSRGWVTLTGQVEWNYQRDAAEKAVRGMAGVTGLFNNIAVSPSATVSDVRGRIEKALARDAELEAAGIRVQVAQDKVTLEGRVHSLYEKRAAERAAWAAPGVRAVEDRLIVS